jgi:hypothetical protein
MRNLLAALGLSTALAAATAVPLAAEAGAAMNYGGQSVADLQHQIAPVEKTQFFFWGGNNWCWYPFGWRGPGWYWCDYEWSSGYGWGGPYGWNGWYVAPYYRSGNGWWWWRHHHHVPTGGQMPGHPMKPMMGAPNHHFAPMMGAPNHHYAPMMGGPAHHFAPMMGGHAPMGHGPGGGGPTWQHK